MKGLFIPEITAERFRNGCLESIEALMAEDELYDIDYSPEQLEPCEDAVSRKDAIIQLSHNKNGDPDCDVIIQHDIETLKRLPSVTSKPRTGR